MGYKVGAGLESAGGVGEIGFEENSRGISAEKSGRFGGQSV